MALKDSESYNDMMKKLAEMLDQAELAAPLHTWDHADLVDRCRVLESIFHSLCYGIAICHENNHECVMCDMARDGTPLAKMVAIEAIREIRRRMAAGQENDDE